MTTPKSVQRTNRNCRFTASIERVDGDGDLPDHLKKFAKPSIAADLDGSRLPPSRLREKILGPKRSSRTFKEQLAEARKLRQQREMESK